MKYEIKRILTDGKVEWTIVDAQSVKEAHERANALNTNGATIKVYADTSTAEGIYASAVWIVKVASAKAVRDTSLTFFEHIRNEAAALNKHTGYLNAIDINCLIAKTSVDTQEFISKAYEGIIDGLTEGIAVDGQYSLAFKKVNSYYKENRNISAKEASTDYIQESGGDLIAVNQYLSRIIYGGERYMPLRTETMSAETAAKLGAALSASAAALTPRQKEILTLTARGYSQRQTADKLNIKSVKTVAEHLISIRKKYLDYFTKNTPELLPLINSAQVVRITNKAHRNKHNAAYYKEYRARKKTEK